MLFDWLNDTNPLIVYIADPMCSWCYGMGPTMDKIKETYPSHEFKMIMGGLRPGGTDTMGSMGEMLKGHWEMVHKSTGLIFNHDVLKRDDFVIDTEPGCRALVVAKKMGFANELEFFHAIQSAFFVENKNMVLTETFTEIADQKGLEKLEFARLFESDEMRYETRADFQLSSEMGIKGFPSVVVRHNGELFLAANGYRKFEDLNAVFQAILNG